MGYFKIPTNRPFPDPDLQAVRYYRADSQEVALCRRFVQEKVKVVIGFPYPGKGAKTKHEALEAIQPWAEVFHGLLKDFREAEIIQHMGHLAAQTPQDLRTLLALGTLPNKTPASPEAN